MSGIRDRAELAARITARLKDAAGLGTRAEIADAVNDALAAWVVAEGGTYTPGSAT